MRVHDPSLRTTSVLHLHHGIYASPWRLLWLLLPLMPLALGMAVGTFQAFQGGYFVAAGCICLVPAAIVLTTEGISGAFTATAIVSLFAYLIYCNAPILFGNQLTALAVEDFPEIGLSVRKEAASVNVAGCIALCVGLLAGYRPPKPVSTMQSLRRSKLHVPDDVLRNSIVVIIGSFILVRLFIIVSSGQSILGFLSGGRSSGDYLLMAGKFGFIVSLATVFQVTAVIGGALLLARKTKVRFGTVVAFAGILIPVLERGLRGGRGQVIGYVLALLAFAMTIPVPRIRQTTIKALPIVAISILFGFAAMSVFRNAGVGGEAASLNKGFEELIKYDQFTALEQCIYVFPHIHDQLDGETLLALPANPIPRAILGDRKPRGLGHVLPGILKDKVTLTLSGGLIGEGWANFQMAGALLLPFFVGLMAALWDRLRNVGSRWADGYALWAAGIPGLFFIVRGSFLVGGSFIMYSVFGMIMLLIVSGRFTNADGEVVRRSSRRRSAA